VSDIFCYRFTLVVLDKGPLNGLFLLLVVDHGPAA